MKSRTLGLPESMNKTGFNCSRQSPNIKRRLLRLPRTIWWSKNNRVRLVDQTLLPGRLKIIEVKTCLRMGECIRDMNVRGAPAIGAAAAFGLALASLEFSGNDAATFRFHLKKSGDYLKRTRPTAVNLAWGVERVLSKVRNLNDTSEVRSAVLGEAKKIAEEDEDTNRMIGFHGSKLIKDGFVIETHCNAGSLATVYYGTALAPIYTAWESGKNTEVIVDETRPRLQGASLTAWELSKVGIPYTLITDNMAAHMMRTKGVDMVIVGADRIIARTGEVFNKIGTYSLAIAAHEHGVPFYVAAPKSTIDFRLKSGSEVKIEERGGHEVTEIRGKRICPPKARVWNPAFDMTPPKYITGIITEMGIFRPEELQCLSPRQG